MINDYGESCIEGHTALIYDRGGTNRIAQLVDISDIEWNRNRRQTSQAIVTITGRSRCARQADVLGGLQSHRHELVVFRGQKRVWEGPIIQVSTTSSQAIITAHDVSEYPQWTPLTKPWPTDPDVPTYMTDRIDDILTYELTQPYTMVVGTGGAATTVTVPRWENIDPPANLLPYLDIRPGTVLTRSNTDAFQMTVLEHIKDLADGGIAWTVVGRSLVVWDMAKALGQTRILTEADFYGDPQVIQSGSDNWLISHLRAQANESEGDESTPDTPSVGNAGGADPYYGVWTNIVSQSSEQGDTTPTQDDLNSQASRDLVGRNPVPLEVRLPASAGLRLSTGLTINDLVPGTVMPLRARLNLRSLSQDQMLTDVKVSETPQGENITVTLVPSGGVVAA